ncbi:hypothetical protein SAMN02799624_04624 [Paenibacillus sp. UNC496MF]|uniref:DUF5345 family protein n=1 Tax=Paenibacillus sp. UNC496MF TaxID=1502753 RepID=UPI0008E8825B|nr:DUF5345 family protein [Paenibacillus sp. UNC496MF]SFJ45596.1 hypothetical protein SAMN02799624_04624 [Paenibacillus sp. UNC496MF]
MKKRDGEAERERAFKELLGEHVEQWDADIEPPIPGEDAFARLVRDHKEAVRGRRRRERWVFLGISVLVLGLLTLLWQRSPAAFAALQGVAFLVGIGVLAATFRPGGEERRRT